MKTLRYSLIIFGAIIFASCKKDNKQPTSTSNNNNTTPTVGKLALRFEANFNDSTLVFNNQSYVTAHGDTIKISSFKYYISNITLTKTDNSTYTVPNAYILVNHDALGSAPVFTLNNIPIGQYKAIKMLIGVDSAKNVSGTQSGDLDPSNGMFWSWSTGYIMLKLEGTSPQSGSPTKSFAYHIGGFAGPNSVLKWITPSFNSATANVSASVTPEIHFSVDVSEIFKTPNTINLNTTYNVTMPGPMAKMIADNYADMITVEHIHNN